MANRTTKVKKVVKKASTAKQRPAKVRLTTKAPKEKESLGPTKVDKNTKEADVCTEPVIRRTQRSMAKHLSYKEPEDDESTAAPSHSSQDSSDSEGGRFDKMTIKPTAQNNKKSKAAPVKKKKKKSKADAFDDDDRFDVDISLPSSRSSLPRVVLFDSPFSNKDWRDTSVLDY